MTESKLVYTIIFIIGSFVLEEVYSAKVRPMPTDTSKPLQCSNGNGTKTYSLTCCASFPGQDVCTALSANITTGIINAVTLINPPTSFTDILRSTVNSTGLTCKNGSASSSQVCLNVTTFDKTQVCFKVSAKNGTKLNQSSGTCASLPTLKVNGTSGTTRRDLTSSLGDLTSILSGITGSSGLGQLFGLLSFLGSIPGLDSLGDLSGLSDLLDLSTILSLLSGGE